MEARPDYETVRQRIIIPGSPEANSPPPSASDPTLVNWDKNAPTGPPTPPDRAIPTNLAKIHNFFKSIIADEAMVLDLCLERAMDIVKFNVEKGLVGIDYFAGDASGGSAISHPVSYAAIAGPLAVELYKQA